MSAEQEHEPTPAPPHAPPPDETAQESLTDFIDRMDRAAFRRVLDHRDLTRSHGAVRSR